MSISDAGLFGLTVAQQAEIDAESVQGMYCQSIFGPSGFGVPRIFPKSTEKRQQRTWEELLAINSQIGEAYLEMKGGGNVKTGEST